jgi:integrase
MASVRRIRKQSGTIVYQAVWREPAGANDQRRQLTRNFSKAADARAHASKMEQDAERRGIADIDGHSVERYLRRWLSTLRDRGEHSPATLAGYARCVDMAVRELGNVPLSRLTAQHLDHAYSRLLKHGGRVKGKPDATRPLTARTVLHVHRCLHTAFEQARKWRMISENAARDATPPSTRKSAVRAFTADEVQRLLEVAARDPETHAIVATLLAGGLRRSELIGLAFDCIDFDAATITVRRAVIEVDHAPVLRDRAKTESSLRTIAIPPELVELLQQQKGRVLESMLACGKEYQRDPLLVFPGLAGAPMIPQSLTDRMRRVMRRAKVAGASPVHAWRHTAGTSLFNATRNPKTVQQRLGHSTPAITMALYVHPVAERDRAAARHFGKLLKG